MPQSSPRSRLRLALGLALGLAHIGLGLWLVIAPLSFYSTYPGVVETGPFNPHFLRDIGCAFVIAGLGLAWFAFDSRARAAALMGAAFLALHALMHGLDGLAGRESPAHLAHDLPLLGAIALAALWVAWPQGAALEPARKTSC
mgnify:CR=1 FL=1